MKKKLESRKELLKTMQSEVAKDILKLNDVGDSGYFRLMNGLIELQNEIKAIDVILS